MLNENHFAIMTFVLPLVAAKITDGVSEKDFTFSLNAYSNYNTEYESFVTFRVNAYFSVTKPRAKINDFYTALRLPQFPWLARVSLEPTNVAPRIFLNSARTAAFFY